MELKYDDLDDTDARDEVQQEIEKRQQRQREHYLKELIFPAIKTMDILYAANQSLIHKLELHRRPQSDDNDHDEEEEEKKSNDADGGQHSRSRPRARPPTRRRHKVRLSISMPDDAVALSISMNGSRSHRIPLSRRMFHNDGLNAAICSNSQSRSVIHRRDLINYREAEAMRAEHNAAAAHSSFLEYPYLLTAGSKARYLEFENLIRQHRARRRRMLDLMMGGAMGGMIGGLNRSRLMAELDLVLRISRKTIVQDTLAILALQQPGDLRKRLRFTMHCILCLGNLFPTFSGNIGQPLNHRKNANVVLVEYDVV